MSRSFYNKTSIVPIRLNNKIIEDLLIKYDIDYVDHKEICFEHKELYALGKMLSDEIIRILK